MKLNLLNKEKKEEPKEEKEESNDALDLFEDDDSEKETNKESILDEEKPKDKATGSKMSIFARRRERIDEGIRPKRKIFNFEWWEYIIILIEIILSAYIIVLFMGGFSL